MMYALAPWEAIVDFLIATGLVLVGIYCMIMFATTHLTKVIVVGVIPFVADIAVFHGIYDVCCVISGKGELKGGIGLLIANMPSPMRISLMFLLLLSGILRLRAVRRTIKSSITEFSIGEALDSIPMGIAFTGDSGIVLQSNHVIHDLCYKMVGMTMIDGDRVWKKIEEGQVLPGMDCTLGESPMITTPEGESWIFRKSPIHSSIGDINQIIAFNATREQQIVRELEENTEKLKDMNKRLRNYNDIVDDTIRREELLAAKMRVHDNMGEVLLATKVLLTNEKSPATREEVLLEWKKDLSLLREEARDEAAPTQLERLKEAADHFGVALKITGDIPTNEDAMELLCVGIQECLTNAIQHAGSDEMYVNIQETDDSFVITYSNNGDSPKYPITEGGGLSILRQAAEKLGAIMEYIEAEQFTLRITLPKSSLI